MTARVMKSGLIVDDSRVIRAVARKIIEDLGYDCDEADQGREALEACDRRMPDLILLDWNMPVMSGIEFLSALRRRADGQSCVVVFCTTENDMSHIRHALEEGANEYIMKPFDADIIRSKLESLGLLSE